MGNGRMTVTTAIVGLGIMGRRMLEHMLRHPGFAPDLLWDPSAEARAAAAAIHPGGRICASAEEAMAGADLVYLACPPAPRKALALKAAEAGRAVFLEKPLGVDVAESEDLVARLDGLGARAAVNFTQAAGPALGRTVAAARSGEMGALMGVDIVVTYPAWPRAWQAAADWLRFREEGGYVREVISHFLFASERVLGPLALEAALPVYPADPALCETHVLARLRATQGAAEGAVVSVLGAVGGAQPDRQEVTVKGARQSRRLEDFYVDSVSEGGPFVPIGDGDEDPRAVNLRAQLDDLALMVRGAPNRLATPAEALRVQKLVEAMLRGA